MRVMFLAFAVTIVIAFAADYALHRMGFSSEERQAAPESVRLGG